VDNFYSLARETVHRPKAILTPSNEDRVSKVQEEILGEDDIEDFVDSDDVGAATTPSDFRQNHVELNKPYLNLDVAKKGSSEVIVLDD